MERGPYNGQRIINIYCSKCLLACYNILAISITKNKKLENYYCRKCNSNESIIIVMFSCPDGNGTSETILHGKDRYSLTIKIDEMYELGLRSLDQKWLVYKWANMQINVISASKDNDLKSLLIEVINKYNGLSSWVFDELINPRENLGQLFIPKPNNLIDVVNNYKVLHPEEISVTDDDSELVFHNRTWSPFTGFIFEPHLGLFKNEFLRLVFYKNGETSWTFEYYYSGKRKSLLILQHCQDYVVLFEEAF